MCRSFLSVPDIWCTHYHKCTQTTKIVNINFWESIKCIQLFCGRLDLKHIFVHCSLTFLNGLCGVKTSYSVVLQGFFLLHLRSKVEFKKLCQDCDVAVNSDCLRYDNYFNFELSCINL